MKKILNLYSYSLTYPALLIYFVFFVVPVGAGLAMAFTDWNLQNLLQPKFNGLDNFKIIVDDARFIKSLWNTLVFAFFTTVFKVMFGLLLALALVQKLKLRSLYRSIFFFPAMLSVVVIGVIFTSVFQMGGLFDQLLNVFGIQAEINWLGQGSTAMLVIILTEIWQWSGVIMIIFIAGLMGIPTDYYEAARIDGASWWGRFKHITFPLLAPAFTISVTISLVGGLKVFAIVYVLTNGGPGFSTQVLSTYIFQAFTNGLLGRSSAMGLVLTVLVTSFTLVLNYFLRRREIEM
ncbi:carbohydrate ABC transporter permease [Paenibacillus eucommiae]|uniref:Raffinose/stachyose/melibiose transport system permease protein n=1 Tax=Paenibacillus eucommiae TaxID=1355755 RepID=A0ABS4J3V0_9BACL|nr:sugar ABC transporter permease [Paenibacillus eucommiae]MBP1994520.1 raffinose/stachyose/melibiose transport system permease protein [Paenibacillus eucommiae]